jgi:hypothetical protein
MAPPTKTSQRPRNEPALTSVSVRLREIDDLRLYTYWEEEPEREVALPGVYQLVNLNLPGRYRYRGYHARGFFRSGAKEIHQKYVYVWQASSPAGTDAKLLYEIWFERGGYHMLEVGAAMPDLKGKRGRPELVLEIGSFDAPRVHYFFLISPARYTRQMLDALAPQVPRLGTRMPDPFWADLLLPGKTGELEPVDVYRARPRLKGERPRGFQVYLLDPLAQAVRHAERLDAALNEWFASVEALGKDDWRSLAIRIHALVGGREELSSDVDLDALRKFIEEAERPMNHAATLAHHECLALVQWIGMESRPHPQGNLYVHEFPGSRGQIRSHPPASAEPRSEFSELVGAWKDRRALPKAVDGAVRTALARVGEHFFGREWLKTTAAAFAKGSPPVADGGTGVLFKDAAAPSGGEAEAAAGTSAAGGISDASRDVARKGTNLPTELQAFILDRVAPDMEEAYLRRVLRTYKVELEVASIGPSPGRAAARQPEVIARGRDLLRSAAPGARLRPRNLEVLQAAGTVGNAIMLAIELHNLKKVSEGIASGDAGAAEESLAASAALADTLGAVSKLVEIVPKAATTALKAGGVLAIIGGSCDLILGGSAAWDSYERKGLGAQAGGEGLRALGGALSAAGGVVALTGVGILPGAILAAMGIAAQLAGSYVVENSNELRVFLQHSRWGRQAPYRLGSGSLVGYPGQIEQLRHDSVGQHQYVSYLVFPFDARFELNMWKELELRVKLGLDVHKWLGGVFVNGAARWSVEGPVTWGRDSRTSTVQLALRNWEVAITEGRTVTYLARFPQVRIDREKDDFVRADHVSIAVRLGTDPKYQATRFIDGRFSVNPILAEPRSGLAR